MVYMGDLIIIYPKPYSIYFRGDYMAGLSKLWFLLGTLNIRGPYYNRDPKRDYNFDNHPYGIARKGWGFERFGF